jgi:hypothetical protein
MKKFIKCFTVFTLLGVKLELINAQIDNVPIYRIYGTQKYESLV